MIPEEQESAVRRGDPENEQHGQGEVSRFERIVGAVLVLCVIILAVQFGLWSYRRFRPPSLPPEPSHSELEVGVRFPVVGSVDLTGDPFDLRPAEAGTPATVLLLLTTTCPFCRVNVPTWNEIHRALGDQVRFVGLSLDDRERTRRFVETSRAEFSLFIVEDSRSLVLDLGLQSVPQTLALDAEGVIQGIWVGGLSEENVTSILQSLEEIVPNLQRRPLEEGGQPEGR